MTDEELSQVGDTGGDEMSLNRQRAREIALGVGKAAAASLIYLLAFSALFQNFEMFPMGPSSSSVPSSSSSASAGAV